MPINSQKIDYLKRELEYALGTPFSLGNSIQVLKNGNEIFPEMLKAINSAQHKIEFVTFVYWQGDIAKEFAAALALKAQQGVSVRVLLDSYGAKNLSQEVVVSMTQAGVDLRWFRPLSSWRLWQSDKRTHRKLLFCDDHQAFIGGVGIADEWLGDARNENEWRDTHCRVKGPVLLSLHAAFLDNWNESGNWLYEPAPSGLQEKFGDVPMQVINSSSTIGWTRIASLMRVLVELTQSELLITTAYFAPDDTIVELLCAAAERGVDVQVLMPKKFNDSQASMLAGQNKFSKLLKSGVTLRWYQKTMLHAKTITVDSNIACIGSANFNHRSFGKDEECTLVMLSEETVSKLKEIFEEDCRYSKVIDAKRWHKRSIITRIKETLARIVVKQL